MSATMTPTPPIRQPEPVEMSIKHFPSSPPVHIMGDTGGETVDADSRSSSLSEIDENGAHEHLRPVNPEEASDIGDTEAETERLEDSPHKSRTNQNVVLAASTVGQQNGDAAVSHTILLSTEPNTGMALNGDTTLQTSDISSLEDSSEGSAASPSRKRKRSAPSHSVQASIEAHAQIVGASASHTVTPTRGPFDSPMEDDEEDEAEGSVASQSNDFDNAQTILPSSVKKPLPKGKRKAKKSNVDNRPAFEGPIFRVGITVEAVEGHDSNDEDVEMEDGVDGVEVEATAKYAESTAKKKTAMDALGAIERCFANLKEKLYAERIARCDAELAVLESSTPNHPELLAALEVIDRHRDKKINYEDTLIKLKLEALQRKSIAEKAQAHSQYMLEVQDIRERHLEKLNKEFYQIQKERRSGETAAPDYMYHFNPRRSEQIKRQIAYNREVSILSGVAKHVGFPAAPDLKPLKQHEIDDDLKAMGITLQPAQAQPRPTLPASSNFARQRSAADERFLEQNPWANPQHPAHSQLQRQRSAVSRPESPLITPAPQKRVIDLTVLQDSASTIPDGPSSSIKAPSATGEQQIRASKSNHQTGSYAHPPDGLTKAPDVHPEGRGSQAVARSNTRKEQSNNTLTPNEHLRQDIHTKSSSHHFSTQNPFPSLESTPNHKVNIPTSPPPFSTVKAEETMHGLHQSPLLHQYQTPTPVSAVANGQVHRLGL